MRVKIQELLILPGRKDDQHFLSYLLSNPMPSIKRVEIPLSKSKLSLLLLGSIVFIATGVWLVMAAPVTHYPVIFCRALGIVCVLFFGVIALSIASKLQDNSRGLIIDEDGITDNSSAVSGGLIVWRDIEDISVIEIGRQKLIILEVRNPEKYIERQTHFLQKKAMQSNLKMYNSPLSISANGLKCDFEDLYRLIKDNLETYINQHEA